MEIFGAPVTGFLIVLWTIHVGLGFLVGQGVASTWRPAWQTPLYCSLLAAAERFLNFALASGDLLSIPGFLAAAVILSAVGLLAWRMTRASMMVAQYPWLYERAGPFGWRAKPTA